MIFILKLFDEVILSIVDIVVLDVIVERILELVEVFE